MKNKYFLSNIIGLLLVEVSSLLTKILGIWTIVLIVIGALIMSKVAVVGHRKSGSHKYILLNLIALISMIVGCFFYSGFLLYLLPFVSGFIAANIGLEVDKLFN